jgi:hypothetical protein
MEVVSDEHDAPPGPRAADLNWAAIHALVQEIPKTFRDPSFSNSGHQISRVVTASDPARELEQVKAWQTSLEGIVDELVGTHHGSLSRSIKNYAKIVHLFEVNRANVDTTRAVLNEGRARLVSDARRDEKVVSAWRRALVGREVARKLADLERMTRVPGTARACVAAGDFETAVALINQSNAELSAPTLETIQTALADVRREVRGDGGVRARKDHPGNRTYRLLLRRALQARRRARSGFRRRRRLERSALRRERASKRFVFAKAERAERRGIVSDAVRDDGGEG